MEVPRTEGEFGFQEAGATKTWKKSVNAGRPKRTSFHNRSPCSFNNGSPRSFGHGRRRLTNRQAFSVGVIDMFSVCVMKHLLERGVIVIHILEEPLLAGTVAGSLIL